MPIYGYRCQSCQREFELQQRMSDPPVAACPDCGGAGTRLFYPAGILFKGSGFYKTDSRSSSAAAAPAVDGAGNGTSKAPATPSTPSTDGKPAPAAKPSPPSTPAPAAAPSAD